MGRPSPLMRARLMPWLLCLELVPAVVVNWSQNTQDWCNKSFLLHRDEIILGDVREEGRKTLN